MTQLRTEYLQNYACSFKYELCLYELLAPLSVLHANAVGAVLMKISNYIAGIVVLDDWHGNVTPQPLSMSPFLETTKLSAI